MTKEKDGLSPLGAAIAGAALGAAAVVLARKENRDKITTEFKRMRTAAGEKMVQFNSEIEKATKRGRKALEEETKSAKDRLDDVKGDVDSK